MLLEMRCESKGHLLVGIVILGFLSMFNKCQESSTFESLNSVCLSRCQRDVRSPVQMSRCQRDVRSPVQMRHRPMAFSGVSTGDSDMPSSCEMKDEPEFKPLQGNAAFF